MYQNLKPFFLFGFLSLLLFACQKEISNRPTPVLSSKNPTALSAEIRVWDGTRTKAALPSPRGGGLQLNPLAQPKVNAFAGRYAIIKPEVVLGDVKGYYVAVSGATDFFTVDYTKPRHINGRVGTTRPKHQEGMRALRMDSISGGNADSALVIALPASIQVPDTICMVYWAYDSLGNISQPVTTCIIVSSLGTDPSSSWMYGTWKATASWEMGGSHDTVIYNKWIAEDWGYKCFTDSATGTTSLGLNNSNSPSIVHDSIFYRKSHLGLSNAGAFLYESDFNYKSVNASSSTCSLFSFFPLETITDQSIGGWNYDRTSGKFQVVMEINEIGQVLLEAWEYKVQRVTDTHFILIDDEDPTNLYFMRFQK